jgi:ketosteroid isomerase-like protein
VSGPALARRVVIGALGGLALPPVAWAQASGDSPGAQDILALREKVRAAVGAKDRATLEAVYADNFLHLRDSGRADVKSDRIALLLSGEPTIETAPEEELAVQVYGSATAVASGLSPIPDPASRTPALFRWVVVFAKDDRGWKVALSQASRVPARR